MRFRWCWKRVRVKRVVVRVMPDSCCEREVRLGGGGGVSK